MNAETETDSASPAPTPSHASGGRERAWTPSTAILPGLIAGSVTRFAIPVEGLWQDPANPERWTLHPGSRYAPSSYHCRWSHTNGRREEVRNIQTKQLVSEREYFVPRDEWLAGLCPLGCTGDRLRVREAWQTHERPEDCVDGILYRIDGGFQSIENTVDAADLWGRAAHYSKRSKATREANPHAYAANRPKSPCGFAGGVVPISLAKRAEGWRSSSSMPPWASRLILRIESVRVGTLQDSLDTFREFPLHGFPEMADFVSYWDTTHAKYDHQKATLSWVANPLVWTLTLARIPS